MIGGGGAQAQLDPILGAGKFVVAGLDVNQVRAKVAVKVVEGGAQRSRFRVVWRREILSRAQYASRKQYGEKEQKESASEAGRGHAVAPARKRIGDGGSAFHSTI